MDGKQNSKPGVKSKTVTVRIAVRALSDGRWSSSGASGVTDETLENATAYALGEQGGRLTYITADVPLPLEPAEVKGKCSDE